MICFPLTKFLFSNKLYKPYFSYFKSQWAMPMSKRFEFYEVFNFSILKLKESGVLQYIDKTYQEKYGGVHRACDSPTNAKGTAIPLHTVVSAIAAMLAGISASAVLVFAEICCHKFNIFQYQTIKR